MAVVVVALIFLLIALAIWNFIILKLKWPPKKNREPPLAGMALPLVAHSFVFLFKKEKLYNIVFENILGSLMNRGIGVATVRAGVSNVYVIMNPEDGSLLTSTCLEKDVVYDFFKPLFGNGLITATVSIWKNHRKLLNPTFSQKILDEYLIEFNRESRQLVKDIAHEVGKGPFDPLPYFKHATLELICSTTMGAIMDDEDKRIRFAYGTYFDKFLTCMLDRALIFYYHSDFLFGFSNLKRKQYALASKIKNFTDQIIRKRRQTREALWRHSVDSDSSKPRAQALLDHLLDLSDDGLITDEEIRDEVNTFVGAGSDTTSNTGAIVLVVLGSYPEVQQKVFEEIEEVFLGSDRDVERQDISKLKYTEAVIKETMRLYPAIPGIGRIIDRELKLKDYVLPAGSRCYMSIQSIGRHPMWGPDAAEFRPERWLNPDELPTNYNASSAFGLGRRQCIGGNFAIMAIKTMMVHLVRNYCISGDVTKMVLKFNIITAPMAGSQIAIEMRHHETKT